MDFSATDLWPPPSSSARSLPTPLTNDPDSGNVDDSLEPEPTKSTYGASTVYDDDDDDDDDDVEEEEKITYDENQFTPDRCFITYLLFCYRLENTYCSLSLINKILQIYRIINIFVLFSSATFAFF